MRSQCLTSKCPIQKEHETPGCRLPFESRKFELRVLLECLFVIGSSRRDARLHNLVPENSTSTCLPQFSSSSAKKSEVMYVVSLRKTLNLLNSPNDSHDPVLFLYFFFLSLGSIGVRGEWNECQLISSTECPAEDLALGTTFQQWK